MKGKTTKGRFGTVLSCVCPVCGEKIEEVRCDYIWRIGCYAPDRQSKTKKAPDSRTKTLPDGVPMFLLGHRLEVMGTSLRNVRREWKKLERRLWAADRLSVYYKAWARLEAALTSTRNTKRGKR